MKTGEIKITFQPSGQSVYALPGTMLLEAAGLAGIILQSPCGGRGTCGKCRVKVLEGEHSPAPEPGGPLSADEIEQGYRLACQTRADGAAVVEIPAESTFESQQRILTGDSGEEPAFNPVVRKVFMQLDKPTSEDDRSDMARIHDIIGDDVIVPAHLMRTVPRFLRAHDWQATAALAGDRLIAVEPGDTSKTSYGVAVDVGTTTVVGTLFDLSEGTRSGVASRMNSQIAYGDDVISRIMKVREDPAALAQLQQSILQTVNDIVATLAGQASISIQDIYEIVLAGNSTMQQILCGFDPSALGEIPFVQVFDKAQTLSASRLGIKANPGAEVYVFPQVGGFVGGDTVAGMVASRLDRRDGPVLFIDIGTNGEIVLAHDGELLATSTAAGPAFEGARIVQGMRAAAGAIEKVIIRDDVMMNVIGNTKPAGICGTALIDAAAELLRAGILDETGRMLPPDEVPGKLPKEIADRLETKNGDAGFVLARQGETANGKPISLWQKDIRELQLATAAIRAGTEILLKRVGMAPEDLTAVLLAGAFGNFIRRSNARRIGLLPQIPCNRIRFIGNAASLGAKLVLLSREERRYATEIRHKMKHVDLSLDPGFQTAFGEAMMFPSSDVDSCPDEPPDILTSA